MPNIIMHTIESELVLKQLQSNYTFSDDWIKYYMCGNLLPDSTTKSMKNYSHFWSPQNKDKILVFPDLEDFLKKYPVDMSSPLLCGYLVHLHFDYLFYHDFLNSIVKFYNCNNEEVTTFSQVKKVLICDTGKFLSPDLSYLYKDYETLNPLLIQYYSPNIPTYIPLVNTTSPIPANQYRSAIEKINNYYQMPTQSASLQVLSFESIVHFIEESSDKAARLLTFMFSSNYNSYKFSNYITNFL